MDFNLTERQQELKRMFESYFEDAMKDAPPYYRSNVITPPAEDDEAWAFHREMQRRLGEKGWLALPWPKEYGGAEASVIDQFIFNEAREKYNCPGYDLSGLAMFAPTLLTSANEEQKKRLLPPMAKGEVNYCQGWSEPDAGSDLANLSTTAIRDGDYYVVNGQKTWTSLGFRASHMFLLARTDPDSRRSKGLSVFHLSMDLPGIELRPIRSLSGMRDWSDTFFKNVRIPAQDLIGGEGNGWAVTQNTMNFERSGIGLYSLSRRILGSVKNYIKSTKRNGKLLSENPIIRQKIARLYAQVEGGEAMALRVVCMQEEGGLVMAASVASESKVAGTELLVDVYKFATEVMGMYGKIDDSRWAPMASITEAYQFSPGLVIAGGSNEIQRSIIAWVGLGLPRYKFQK